MKLRGLLLGALAISGLAIQSIPNDDWLFPNFPLAGGGGSTSHRSSGARAHRKWKQRRASGRA